MNYSIDDIVRYISGNMPDDEAFELERNSLKNPFLFQALEGYKKADIEDLKKLSEEKALNFESLLKKKAKATTPTTKIVDEETFKELIKSIVYDFLPNEVASYSIIGEYFVHEAFEEHSIKTKNKIGHLNFTENSKSIISFKIVILTAYALLKELKVNLVEKSRKAVTKRWIALMVEKGIEHKKAEKIALKYAESLF